MNVRANNNLYKKIKLFHVNFKSDFRDGGSISAVDAQRVILHGLTKRTHPHPVHWLSEASDKSGKITLAALLI